MARKRKRGSNSSPLNPKATGIFSVVAEEVMTKQILTFLHRKSVLQLMSIKPIQKQFQLSSCFCPRHGSTLEPKQPNNKHLPLQCEDCRQARQGKTRCDDCDNFEEQVYQCDQCGIDRCLECLDNHCTEENDGRGYCHECKSDSCGVQGCPCVYDCEKCMNSFCTDCQTVSTCTDCGQQHCDNCFSVCTTCQEWFCADDKEKTNCETCRNCRSPNLHKPWVSVPAGNQGFQIHQKQQYGGS